MAAYGAAGSLKSTIQSLLESSRISLVPPSQQILQSAYDAMCFLQNVLRKLDDTGYSKIRTKVNALDERIKEVVWEFEDLLESHYTNQILPQLESERDRSSFLVDMQSLRQSVDCFIERVTAMEAEYDIELLNMPEEESEPISSRIDFGGINSEMVGLKDEFEQVRDRLIKDEENRLLVTGMAGVGKTTLVKKVFDDPSIQRHFNLRAWVKVGRKWECNEMLRCILAQVDPNTHGQMLTQVDNDDEETLFRRLEDRLKAKKCLIVLDDVWDTRFMRTCWQGRIYMEVERGNCPTSYFPTHVYITYFKKCEGLPLMIVTVAKLLTKAEELLNREELNKCIQEYWTEVAEKQHNPVFEDAYNQISEVFFPSYEYLPQFLKMVFLYLGAYPPYCNIDLQYGLFCINAEGFVDQIENLVEFEGGKQAMSVFTCLVELANRYHLLLFDFDRVSWFSKEDFRVHSC